MITELTAITSPVWFHAEQMDDGEWRIQVAPFGGTPITLRATGLRIDPTN